MPATLIRCVGVAEVLTRVSPVMGSEVRIVPRVRIAGKSALIVNYAMGTAVFTHFKLECLLLTAMEP